MEKKPKNSLFIQRVIVPLVFLWIIGGNVFAFEKRDRWSGLNMVTSSSTMGKGNFFLSMHGNAFLWDNQAAEKLPTILPNLELGYGVLDYLHIVGGLEVRTTKPSLAYLKFKITTPNTKSIRFFGVSQSIEMYRNLLDEFKSNGFRYKNEGFSPDKFIIGNDDYITFFRFITSMDVELIKWSAYLPFKFYFNIGFEGGLSSWMAQNVQAARDVYKTINNGKEASEGSTNFSKVPISFGVELKTQKTDFFIEVVSEPFLENIKKIIYLGNEKKDLTLVRYNVVVSGKEPLLKILDIHLFEVPIYLSIGSKLKYSNGSTFQFGFSWLLSHDVGASLGPCNSENKCREGAEDGFSPFYPQWKLFGRINYPIRFKQSSAELYRAYILKKNKKSRKVLDINNRLKGLKDKEAGRDE